MNDAQAGPKGPSAADLAAWNSDRRYLAELDGNGLPVPPTLLIAPLGPVPELHGPVMVRPVDRTAKSGHRGDGSRLPNGTGCSPGSKRLAGTMRSR